MKSFKRRLAALLAFVMAFSSVAIVGVSADTITPRITPVPANMSAEELWDEVDITFVANLASFYAAGLVSSTDAELIPNQATPFNHAIRTAVNGFLADFTGAPIGTIASGGIAINAPTQYAVGAWVGGVGTLTTSNTLYDLFDEAGAPYEALQDELIDWIHDNVDIALFVRAIPPDTNVEHIVVNTVQLLNVATATTTPRTALPNVAMSSVSTGSLNLVGTVLPTYATNTTVNFAIYPSATTAGNPGIVAGTLSVDAPGVVVVRAYVTNGTVVPTSADFETWFQVTFTAWVDPAIALAEAHARRSLTHLTGTGVHIRGQLTNVDQWSRLVDNHTMDALGGTNLLGASVLDGAIPRPIAPAPEFIIPNHLLGGGQGGSVTLELTGWGGQPWRNAFALPEATNLNAAAPNYVQTANNVGMLPTPANAGWHQQSQDHWFYSGLQSPGTGQFSEIPFEARFNGTQVTITWPAFVPGAGTILRMPLIAQGTNANFTAHPVLTMTNAAGVQSELAFATAGAGVRASIGGARTGITFVNVQDLVI